MLHWQRLPVPLRPFHNVPISNHANIHVVDLHRLPCMFELVHIFLMFHDFLKEQPWQFQYLFLDIRAAFGSGNGIVHARA